MKLDVTEALRYLGVRGEPDPDLAAQVAQTAEELTNRLTPRYTYQVFDLTRAGDGIRLAGTEVVLAGSTAARMLGSCRRAALLACTLGARFDRMLLAAQARDMAQAVVLDACGGAWVEAGCDAAQAEIAARFPGQYLTDRFSPGYGDLPLAVQEAICSVLDAPRRLGIQVRSSLLMNPSKSVTAVIGLADRPQPARIRGCTYCALAGDCTLRKGGRSCAD